MESMSSSHRVTEPGGARFTEVFAYHYLGGWKGHSDMIVMAEGPKQASRVSTT